MSTRSNSSHLFSPLRNPESLIRRRNLGEPTSVFDFEEVMNNNQNPEPPPQNGPPPMCQFHGFLGDDANQHIDKFLEITQHMKQNGVSDDALRLSFFPYSLTHHAIAWYDHLPRKSIQSFDDMMRKFLSKYFPPSMVTKLRNEITKFEQKPHESFYNGLTLSHRNTINAATRGTFMQKTPKECYELIENMTAHHNHWDTSAIRDETSINISSTYTTESPEVVRQLEMMNKNFSEMMRQFQTIKGVDTKCETYGGPQSFTECPVVGTCSLPSNTVLNPREDLKAITTRSGVTLARPSVSPSSSSNEPSLAFTISSTKMPEVTKDTVQPSTKNIQPPVAQTQIPIYEPVVAPKPKPTIPYPSRVNIQKLYEKDDNLALKFVEIFRNLHFELSFAYALLHMPMFALMFKSLFNNKEKLFDLATTLVNENCSAVILKKFPEKLGDPDKFLIPRDFAEFDECLALANLGASINLMPLSIWKNLSLPELTSTQMILELTDRSTTRPAGIAKDVFVKVGKIGRALIDVYGEELTLRVDDEAITFKVGQTSKYSYNYDESINRVDIIDVACEEYVQEVSPIHCVPKKGGIIVVENENNELIPTRLVTGLEVNRAKVDVIAKLPHPTTVKVVRIFIGHAGFYRRFIQDFSKIARPMPHLLEKETPFVFSKDCIDAFETFKKKLTEALILVFPDWNLPFELMCDASDFEIGTVLGHDCLKDTHWVYSLQGDHQKLKLNELNELRHQAYENSLIHKEKTKKHYDSKIKNRVFNVGDRVLLFNSRLKIFSGKLKTHWTEPFTIVHVFPYGTIELSQPDGPPNFKVRIFIKKDKMKAKWTKPGMGMERVQEIEAEGKFISNLIPRSCVLSLEDLAFFLQRSCALLRKHCVLSSKILRFASEALRFVYFQDLAFCLRNTTFCLQILRFALEELRFVFKDLAFCLGSTAFCETQFVTFCTDCVLSKFRNQRTVNIAGARKNVGSPVVQQSGIQCFNCKEFGHFAKECRKLKRVKDSAYHKENMLLCKQAEQGVPLQAEQYDWLADSGVEMDDSNVIPDSPDMCEDDIQNDQNDVESDDEHVALANLIANLKLDVDENKKNKQTEFEKYKAFNDHTIDYDKLECKLNEALGQLAQKDIEIKEDQFHALTAQDMEILIQTCLMSLAIMTHNDSFLFVHELKQEMHVDLKYVESLEKEIDELESDKAEFSNMYDMILHECVSKDVMCSYFLSLSDLDAIDELQCLCLNKVKECDCLAQKLSNQTDSVSREVHFKLLKCFAKVEKHSISLEIAFEKRKELVKNDTVWNEKASNVFRKEREQYIKIQDLKAQLQYKNVGINCKLILFIVESGCTKHTTRNLKLLCNFVEIFLGTVRFGNDQFVPILRYGDLVQGNVTRNKVYYVEGLNYNLFSVGQFFNADLEVAFRKSSCFVKDLQGYDLLTYNRGSDLYTNFPS
nr:reverse transcriptase domain-containing protein [Tanacetum cinerariifolium]